MLGGAPTPAVGFGLGMERFLMLLEENHKLPPPPSGPILYAVGQGEEGRRAVRHLASHLRAENMAAEIDLSRRSVKAQMKSAGNLGALYTTVVGEEETQSGIVRLKRMSDGASVEVPLAAALPVLKFLHSEDPLASSGVDLESVVSNIGPSVIFEDEE